MKFLAPFVSAAVLATSISSAVQAQEIKRDIVYDKLSYQQTLQIINDMGVDVSLIERDSTDDEQWPNLIIANYDSTGNVLIFPRKCFGGLCERFLLYVKYSGASASLEDINLSNRGNVGKIYSASDGDLTCDYLLRLDGGVSANHIKQSINATSSLCTTRIKAANDM